MKFVKALKLILSSSTKSSKKPFSLSVAAMRPKTVKLADEEFDTNKINLEDLKPF